MECTRVTTLCTCQASFDCFVFLERYEEMRFTFGWCARPHEIGASDVEWEPVGSPEEVAQLQNQFEAVRQIALQIRRNAAKWESEQAAATKKAAESVVACGSQLRKDVVSVRCSRGKVLCDCVVSTSIV